MFVENVAVMGYDKDTVLIQINFILCEKNELWKTIMQVRRILSNRLYVEALVANLQVIMSP